MTRRSTWSRSGRASVGQRPRGRKGLGLSLCPRGRCRLRFKRAATKTGVEGRGGFSKTACRFRSYPQAQKLFLDRFWGVCQAGEDFRGVQDGGGWVQRGGVAPPGAPAGRPGAARVSRCRGRSVVLGLSLRLGFRRVSDREGGGDRSGTVSSGHLRSGFNRSATTGWKRAGAVAVSPESPSVRLQTSSDREVGESRGRSVSRGWCSVGLQADQRWKVEEGLGWPVGVEVRSGGGSIDRRPRGEWGLGRSVSLGSLPVGLQACHR